MWKNFHVKLIPLLTEERVEVDRYKFGLYYHDRRAEVARAIARPAPTYHLEWEDVLPNRMCYICMLITGRVGIFVSQDLKDYHMHMKKVFGVIKFGCLLTHLQLDMVISLWVNASHHKIEEVYMV